MKTIKAHIPFDTTTIKTLKSGDRILLTGTLFAARDEAHKRLVELKNAGKSPVRLSIKPILCYSEALLLLWQKKEKVEKKDRKNKQNS